MVDHPLQWAIYAFFPLLAMAVTIFALFSKNSKDNLKTKLNTILECAIGVALIFIIYKYL
jgi:energy-converting hydrogenase Eha subunit E